MAPLPLRVRDRRGYHRRVALRLLAGLVLLFGTALPATAGKPHASDFPCLTKGIRPAGKNFFVYHKNKKKLRQAVEVAERDQPGERYPAGTVLQLLPFEAMMKRNEGYNPTGNDWEFFQLDVDAKGKTTIRSAGRAEVKNFSSCQACHLTGTAAEHDLVCEGHASLPILFTLDQVRVLQAADPRCKKKR